MARAIVALLEDVPPSVAPLDAVGVALESWSEFFDDRRPYSKNRQAVIDANPALQERELIKLDSMATMCSPPASALAWAAFAGRIGVRYPVG